MYAVKCECHVTPENRVACPHREVGLSEECRDPKQKYTASHFAERPQDEQAISAAPDIRGSEGRGTRRSMRRETGDALD